MKVIYRIPTGVEYAYVEIEKDEQGSPADIAAHYQELLHAFRPQEGLSEKDWNKALDRYLAEGDCESDVYASMSPVQKNVMQEIKRSTKRINYRNSKQ